MIFLALFRRRLVAKRKKLRSVTWWLRKTGALIKNGHFVLKSGQHSDSYANKDALYTSTAAISSIGKRLANHFFNKEIGAVVGPEKGGIILAQWVAHHLNCLYLKAKNKKRVLALYAEKDGEGFALRRGYDKLARGKKILLVEDIITTGGSIKKVVEAMRSSGGEVVAIGAICNRGEATAESLGVPELKTLIRLRLPIWEEKNCPKCAKGVPVNTELGHGREYLESKKPTPQ